MDRSWVELNRMSDSYKTGLNNFIGIAVERTAVNGHILCPCRICCNRYRRLPPVVYQHMVIQGMDRRYMTGSWVSHGDEFRAGASNDPSNMNQARGTFAQTLLTDVFRISNAQREQERLEQMMAEWREQMAKEWEEQLDREQAEKAVEREALKNELRQELRTEFQMASRQEYQQTSRCMRFPGRVCLLTCRSLKALLELTRNYPCMIFFQHYVRVHHMVCFPPSNTNVPNNFPGNDRTND